MIKSNEAEVIKSIYATCTDEANWRDALDNCSEFVGASSAGLVVADEVSELPYEDRYLSSLYYKVDPQKLQYYRDHLRKYENQAWHLLKTLPPMTIISDDAYRAQVAQQEDFVFFRDVLGVDRRMVCRINDHPAWFDALAFQFDAKLQARPEGCEQQFHKILPHIAMSLQMGRIFWQLQRKYKIVLGALSHIKIGMCVAVDGEIIVHNDHAENIFLLEDGITLKRNKKLGLNNTDMQAGFNAAVVDISITAKGEGSKTTYHCLAERPSGEQSFLIEIAPLRDALGEIGKGMSGALISIIDPTNTQDYDFKRVADIYRLTDAEEVICKLMVEGYGNQEIADIRNVSTKTIKNQVTSIYKKTEANSSRASLIRKIVMTAPPIILN